MAPFVYDGVPGNGHLFAGIKFCILQRVPIRCTLIQNVESNGGEIVPLEKHADMIISDDARPKLAPPNSYSWKYIEQSVKNGELENAEKHLIHAASTSNGGPVSRAPGHTAGYSRPTKSTRTAFTPADDKILLNWVAKAQKQGMGLMGNMIYEQLEKENSRHTWQSWKDRYNKYYRDKPLPKVSKDDSLGPVDQVARGLRSHPQAAYQVDHAEDDHGDGEDQEASAKEDTNIIEELARYAPKVVEGEEFSQADHNLLEKEYEAILNIEREGESVIKAWRAFEKGHGRHTADEWYTYFHRVVKPVMGKKPRKVTNLMPQVITIDDGHEDSEARQGPRKKLSKSSTSTTSKADIIASEVDDEELEEDNNMVAMDFDMPQAPEREDAAQILQSKSSNVSSVLEGSVRTGKPSPARKQSNASAHDKRNESFPEEKAAFLDGLRNIARATHKQIEPRQEVCGVQIQLYDLWSTIIDKFEGFESVEAGDMWGRVATHLGFNISKHPDAAAELRNLYSTLLVKVERVDKMSGAGILKTAMADAHSTTQEKQKTVTTAPVTEPGAPPKSHTAPHKIWSLKNPRKHSHAPTEDTPASSNPLTAAQSDPPSISGNESITSKSMLNETAVGAPTRTNLQVTAVQQEDNQTTESPMQFQIAAESSESPAPSIEGADEEELTAADLVMLTKLVDFAKDCLGIQINVTGTAICGRWVSLPKFRKVVNGLGGYKTVTRKKLWKQVAAELGFKQMGRYQGMAKEMQNAYEDVLMHYDDYRRQVREERERRASIGVQGLQSFDDEDSGVAAPYTSPRQTGSSSAHKRSRNVSSDDGPTSVPDTFKRRRLDRKGKGKEIQAEVPESPEHIYNSSMLSQEPSIANDSQLIELSSDSESDGTVAYQPIKRPFFQKSAAPQAPATVEEPDTQEFSFIEECSPSQQLNSGVMTSTSLIVPAKKRATSPVGEDEVTAIAGSDIQEYYAMCATEGYTRDVAIRALSAANMDPVLAQKILNRVERGQPIPDNIRGVWTSKDDEVLLKELPADHPSMAKLIRKHGAEELKDRLEFLENLGEAAEDE